MTKASIRRAVVESIEELTGVVGRRILDDDILTDDLGVDSFSAANLLASVEDKVGARLPGGVEGALVGARTFGELVLCLAAAFEADQE